MTVILDYMRLIHINCKETKSRQFFSSLAISYLCISCGHFLGYTSSAIPSFKEDEIFSQLTTNNISWIASLGPLGGLCGSLLTTALIKKYGSRKLIWFFGCPLMILSWGVIALARTVVLIYIGRFLGGCSTGIIISSTPLYIIEISEPTTRGKLGILPQFLMLLGILTSYIFGSFLNWRFLSIACGLLSIPSALFLYYVPESPSYLIAQNNNARAGETLEFLHGQMKAVIILHELQSKLLEKRKMMQNGRQSQNQNNINYKRRSWKTYIPQTKSLIVALGLMSFSQLTGVNGITFYASTIFSQTQGTVGSTFTCIILGFIQVLACFLSYFVVERAGRKLLLIFSASLMASSTGLLGMYFYHNLNFLTQVHFVPLVTLSVYFFGFAIGFGPLSWLLVTEILFEEIRHCSRLCIAYAWICTFVVTHTFPKLISQIGLHGIFWIYSSISLISIAFVILFVPETKGIDLKKIRAYFGDNGNSERYYICDSEGQYEMTALEKNTNEQEVEST